MFKRLGLKSELSILEPGSNNDKLNATRLFLGFNFDLSNDFDGDNDLNDVIESLSGNCCSFVSSRICSVSLPYLINDFYEMVVENRK